MTLKAYCLM
jgi:hypothetical protein